MSQYTKVLLDANADLVSCQDRYGKAPLHCAVEAENEELVQLLLQYGADINIRCHDGMTPLMMCCTADTGGNKTGLMRLLLEAGAMIDLKDFRGKRTALHVSSDLLVWSQLIKEICLDIIKYAAHYMFYKSCMHSV